MNFKETKWSETVSGGEEFGVKAERLNYPDGLFILELSTAEMVTLCCILAEEKILIDMRGLRIPKIELDPEAKQEFRAEFFRKFFDSMMEKGSLPSLVRHRIPLG